MSIQTKYVSLRWNALSAEERIAILNVFYKVHGRIGPQVLHTLIYGTWEQLGESIKDKVYLIDWHAALGLNTARFPKKRTAQ